MGKEKRTSGRVTTARSTLPEPTGGGTPVNELIAALKPFNPWTHPERLEVNLAFIDISKTANILNDGRVRRDLGDDA